MTLRQSLSSRALRETVLRLMCCIELLVCLPGSSTMRSLIGGIEHTDALFDELREAGKEDELKEWVSAPAFTDVATSNSSSCSTSWQRL